MTTNATTRYRQIEVFGAPAEMGRQIGEAARTEVRGFCEMAMDHIRQTVSISREKAMSVASKCLTLAAAYSRETMQEVRGVAEAANVSTGELMLLQVRNQLLDEVDSGCTSLSCAQVEGVQHGGMVLAQNWDNDPDLDPFTIVLTRRPMGKPALMCVTQAGLVAYFGFNEHGIGVCMNTLPAPKRDLGVPHYFILREVYEKRSLDEAVASVRRARRAVPINMMMATPQGPADLEITIDDVHVLTDPHSRCLTHTNHCLHTGLRAINGQFPELIQSGARIRRIEALLGGNGEFLRLEDIKSALRDHANYPTSICRHKNDDPAFGFWKTVFSVIIEPGAQRMHISRGNPCEHAYETYTMN